MALLRDVRRNPSRREISLNGRPSAIARSSKANAAINKMRAA